MKASGNRGICDSEYLHPGEKLGELKRHSTPGLRKKNMDCYRGKHKGGIKMPYNSKTLGLIIGTERVKRGMTQEQLSGLAGISRSHLAALECGQKSPRIETLWRVAEALGVKPSKLIIMMEKSKEREDDA